MNYSPRRWWLLLACVCLALAAGPAYASTRNYLTVEGRVLDHLGHPLTETWVICTGSRRASVTVDSSGRYHLEIPGATLEELERTPLKIRVQARKKGYRFALSNGAPELGLEMRVVKEDGPLSRLRVRSNDSSAVSAVGNSVVLDANPRALLTAQFVGSRGAQYDTPPVPLDESDEITLAGSSQSIPELAASESAWPAPVPPPAVTPAKPSPVTSMPPVSSPPAAGRDSSFNMRMPAVRTRVPGNAGDAEPRKWNAGGSNRDRKPRVARPGIDPGAPETPRDKQQRAGAVADERSTAHAGPAGNPPDTVVTNPAAERQGAWSDPSLRQVLPKDLPAERVTPGSQPPIQRVPTAPGVPVPGPRRGTATPSAPMCDCTIRGSVEVQWDRPLTSRTEVVIAVEDAPDVSTSAELFMGSPRAFEIHPAPCGVHRLLLWTRSKQRFVLVSQEPRVVCTPGGVQQMRLVLEPVARWGTAQ